MTDTENTSIAAPPIEDRLDLHHFQPRELPQLLDDYLTAAAAAGHQQVLIIHGKGRGILKNRARVLLTRHPLAASFRDAPPDRGGWGATVVNLAPAPGAKHALRDEPDQRAPVPESRSGLSWNRLLLGLLAGLALGLLVLKLLLP